MSKDAIVETWTMNTPRGSFDFAYKADQTPALSGNKPVWMENFKRQWDNPQDPVHYEFDLKDESYVQDAFNFLYNGPANGIKYPGEEPTNDPK